MAEPPPDADADSADADADPPPPPALPLAAWRLPVGALLVLASVVLMLAPGLLSSIDPRQDGRELDCHQTVEVRVDVHRTTDIAFITGAGSPSYC